MKNDKENKQPSNATTGHPPHESTAGTINFKEGTKGRPTQALQVTRKVQQSKKKWYLRTGGLKSAKWGKVTDQTSRGLGEGQRRKQARKWNSVTKNKTTERQKGTSTSGTSKKIEKNRKAEEEVPIFEPSQKTSDGHF